MDGPERLRTRKLLLKFQRNLSLPLKFSRLLLVRRNNREQDSKDAVYALLLTLTDSSGQDIDAVWHGTDYTKRRDALPLDPPADLGELIPDQEYFKKGDKAFEKLGLICKAR